MANDRRNFEEVYLRAQQAFARGAFDEAFAFCNEVLQENQNSDSVDDLLRLKFMRLLLALADVEWRGQTEIAGAVSIPRLLDEAEQLARDRNQKAILAQIMQLRAGWLLYRTGVLESIEMLRSALAVARESQDKLTEFCVLSALGHQTVKVDMDEGIALLYRAQELFNLHNESISSSDQAPELQRLQRLARASLGINEFDRGNYDRALRMLKDVLNDAERNAVTFDFPVILNFVGQVETAAGLFEDAEIHLKQAIAVFENRDRPDPWNGNNLALLGKLYLEWERFEDATAPLERSWEESVPTHNLDLISLVRNYYGEFLMHPQNARRDVARAEQILRENLEETRATSIHRSTIQSLTLLGRLMLDIDDREKAFAFSQEAVSLLDELGNMPALRMEEIYYNHYFILMNLGQTNEAKKYLERAYDVIQAIDVADTEKFFTRIPLNRAILSARQQ